MVYATIGIPLFFVVMANLGRVLTRALKFLWSYVRRLYYTQTFRRVRKGISHCVRSKCLRRRDNTTLTSTDTAPAAAAVAAQSDDTEQASFSVQAAADMVVKATSSMSQVRAATAGLRNHAAELERLLQGFELSEDESAA